MREALEELYKTQLTNKAKESKKRTYTGSERSKHLGWVYLAETPQSIPKAVRTYHSLFTTAEGAEYQFFTPNTFYHDRNRRQSTLRWINAFSVDIDVCEGDAIYLPEIMDAISSAGLPRPSLVVKTPSGGCHIHWYLNDSKRAYKRVCEHYNRIARVMAEELSGDLSATTAERFFRIPKDANTLFRSHERVTFDELCDWYSLRVEERTEEKKGFFKVGHDNLMAHPAIQKLLQGVEKGQRDETCYTLALAFKSAGYDRYQAEARLLKWNRLNDPQMRQLDIKRKVVSAFREGGKKGPSAFHIRRLSGVSFTYTVWEPAKPREKRVYSHKDEWKNDLIILLKERGGVISGAQRELAKELGIPYTTFKAIIKDMASEGTIKKATTRGRGGHTVITLNEIKEKAIKRSQKRSQQHETPREPGDNGTAQQPPAAATANLAKINESNSNTLIDGVAGGRPKGVVQEAVGNTNSLTSAPIPRNVPERFVSAFFNRGCRDGRLIFASWGRFRLAVQSLGVSPRHLHELLQLSVDAVGISFNTCSPGKNLDRFLKFLYGTCRKLLLSYREQCTLDFVDYLENLPEPGLYSLRDHYLLKRKKGYIPGVFEDEYLSEIECEIGARSRRKSYASNGLSWLHSGK